MGNQASKAIDKTRERKSERKSKHRAQSFVSTSASSTERSSRTQTDEPDTSSSTHKIITSSSDIVQATTRPNRRPTTSRKKHKSGLVIDQDDFKEIDRSQRQVSKSRNAAPPRSTGTSFSARTSNDAEESVLLTHVYKALCSQRISEGKSQCSISRQRGHFGHWHRPWRLGLRSGIYLS